jgi:hypothetical protein
MATDQDSFEPEFEEPESVCEVCGAEGATYESWSDEDGHVVLLCEDCAHPRCFRCSERISERPVWGWSDDLGEMVPLCEKCAAEAGDEFDL